MRGLRWISRSRFCLALAGFRAGEVYNLDYKTLEKVLADVAARMTSHRRHRNETGPSMPRQVVPRQGLFMSAASRITSSSKGCAAFQGALGIPWDIIFS